MKAFILIIFLTSVVCKEIIRVEKGDSVTLVCSTNATQRCTLMKNKELEADRFGDNKFHLVNSTGCKFEASNLNFTDNGDYICRLDDDKKVTFRVLVTVKPNEPELWLSGERIENNTRKVITTRADGSVEFVCKSYQGYPKATFLWFVDNVLRVEAREEVFHANRLLNVNSILTVNFDVMQYAFEGLKRHLDLEKLIKCVVVHDAYHKNESRVLLGVFGKAYATGSVSISENPLDNRINPGEVKEIVCEADGLPEANDYQIKRLNTKGDWVLVSATAVTNISEAGDYMCFARNNENGTYIKSSKVTFLDPVVVSEQKTINFGAIIGIVFGSLLLVAILVGIAYFIFCRKPSKERKSSRERDAADEQEIQRMNEKPAAEKSLHSEI